MKCSFCNNELAKGTGKMFVRISGQVLYFCSNKCEKNMLKLNRIPREQKWVSSANKEMTSEDKKQESKKPAKASK